MNHRIAGALIGTALGLATFAGSTIAATAAAPDPAEVRQDEVSELICEMLGELGFLDHPELADFVEELGCDETSPTSTTTTTSTTTSPPSSNGRR
ncbi:hypothetical protein AB0I60_00635 [Actinosynnema sp. NPDC050436]|uniref:hypothetical protein n=1 Tax=Actinosynnema sp. NPDC050436 TaxID=3155659 RepID=UPI0033E73D0D